MKEKKKKINKLLRRIFLSILIAYTAIYLSQATGYAEYQNHKNIELTSEQIKKFERDVKEGKDVDVLSYIEKDEKDYSSRISRFGLKLSDEISLIVKKIIDKTFKSLNDLFTE